MRARIGSVLVLLAGTLLLGAAPVEEAVPVRADVTVGAASPDQVDVAEPTSDGTAMGVANLFYRLQIAEDELRRLQGLVEEQNYRIERLVREQRERYIELDQRLLAMRGSAPTELGESDSVAPVPTVAPGEGGTQGEQLTQDEQSVPSQPTGAGSSQQDAYNQAFAVFTEARQLPASERLPGYQRALTKFEALIQQYPNGAFTPNAYYWKGELYLAIDQLEDARQSFAQVANLFEDHAKVPDALYKLAVTYHRLGDSQRALQYLDRVVDNYPEHTAANLARSYARELR